MRMEMEMETETETGMRMVAWVRGVKRGLGLTRYEKEKNVPIGPWAPFCLLRSGARAPTAHMLAAIGAVLGGWSL